MDMADIIMLIMHQLQYKYLVADKLLYLFFVDLKKAFDRVPRKVWWWLLRSLSVEGHSGNVLKCRQSRLCKWTVQ